MFDGLTTKFEPEVALNRPSAKALSHILRHPKTWPKGFKWDYTDCRYCAIGLANKLWHITYLPLLPWFPNIRMSLLPIWGSAASIGRAVGFPPSVAQHIFYRLIGLPVTPENVADAIDAYLTKTKESSHV